MESQVETQSEEQVNDCQVDANGQASLIPDDIVEEQETREVLIPLHPHEVLELVDRMATLNEELKGHKSDEEKEKTRHKEAKEAINGRISTCTENISKLIDQAGMRKRKSLEKTIKRINHTTKMVEWIWNDIIVDSRPMVAAEFQLKLLPDDQAQENVVGIDSAKSQGDSEEMTHAEALGDDPASFEDDAVAVEDDGGETIGDDS